MARSGQNIINEEVTFGHDEELVSVTDTRGVITYANQNFCKVAGYSKEELVGKNHNIVRHPDMPKAAFADMWTKLKAKQAWRGAVKNRCKDGRYYWVDAFVTPVYQDGQLTGYQSVRRRLQPEYKTNAQTLYSQLNEGKASAVLSAPARFSKDMVFLALAFAIAVLALFYPFVAFALIALPYLVFKDELIQLRQYLLDQQGQYDSISRLVYSGKNIASVADFMKKMDEVGLKPYWEES